MSHVPASKSEVSENPSKNAVTHSVTPKEKAADVDRKMRFFGVIQAFREGRYPDNKQIDDTLKYTLASSPVDVSKLSAEGQRLIQDVREIIESARQIVGDKNSGEELQNFLYATRKADVKSNVNVKSGVNKDDAQKDGESASEAFRTLVTLFLRNGEVRKIVRDLGYVGRDVFADGAAKAANSARPDEEKLSQVDQPAPDNEFNDDIPERLKRKKADAEQTKDAAVQDATDAANAVDPNAPTDENKDVVQNKSEQLKNRIPQKHRDLAKEHYGKGKDYMTEKFPKERRDQFIYRLKKVVVECQRHRDYQDAMDFFLSSFEQYKGHANNVHSQATGSAKGVRGEANVATAESAFRKLIERFANGKPTQPIIDAVDQIYTLAQNDSELRDWFKRLDIFIRKSLQEPGFIMKDEANTQARQLRDSGKTFFVAGEGREQGKYKPQWDRLTSVFSEFSKGLIEDPLNKQFGEDWKRLVHDLFLNAEGKPTFKPALWSDILEIAPSVLSHFGLVPIPRIEYTDPQVDLVIENLALDPVNLLFNQIEMETKNYFKLSHLKKLGGASAHDVKITVHQIQTDLRDVGFVFHKKQGFKLKEQGVADIFLGGKGLTLTVELAGETNKNKKMPHVFTVKSVKAKIDKLNFAVRGSHGTLVKLVKPIATGIVKKQIAKAAEQGIRGALEDLDRQLVELRDRAEANKDAEGKGFGDAWKDTFKKEEAKEKKEPKGSFKLATSKRTSLLPNLGQPDGWVNKIDERSESAKAKPEAAGSREWYSSAFSIVAPNQPDPRNTRNSSTEHAAINGTAAPVVNSTGTTGVNGSVPAEVKA